jgi:3'-phosphoadenosine 5'-phosphosulfate sulfotransferase (PAPS reductase)/FAD synthetase
MERVRHHEDPQAAGAGGFAVSDPFKLTGPTCLSFSGGRTSAYMLWLVLQSNTREDIERWLVICFANTGKEDEATLRFVQACADNWGVRINWLEYVSKRRAPFYQWVTFDTASRAGEPLLRAFAEHSVLPNPVSRYCTAETKIRTIRRYLEASPRRAAKLSASTDPRDGTRLAPLVRAGITASMVGEFWKAQSFDLGLRNINGIAPDGNCDLCFLKPAARVLALIQEKPARAVWWAKAEEGKTADGQPARFRNDRPSFDPDEEAIACFCGD